MGVKSAFSLWMNWLKLAVVKTSNKIKHEKMNFRERSKTAVWIQRVSF